MFCVVIIFLLVESTAISKNIQETCQRKHVDWVLLSFLWLWVNIITRDLGEVYFGMAVTGTLIFMFSFVRWKQKRCGPLKSASLRNSPIQANMPVQEQALSHWQWLQRGGEMGTAVCMQTSHTACICVCVIMACCALHGVCRAKSKSSGWDSSVMLQAGDRCQSSGKCIAAH